MTRPLVVLALAFASASLLAACSSDRRITSTGVDSPLPRSEPENVLLNLAYAYRYRDIDLYGEQFRPDFRLVVDDIHGHREHWNAMEGSDSEKDLASTRRLFDNSEWITFEMLITDPRPSAVPDYPGDEGYLEIKAHSVLVEIQPHGSADTFVISNDEARFVLIEDAGEGWRIAYWELLGSAQGSEEAES